MSPQSQSVVYTFCLNSDDARVDAEGDFNFELGQAVASLEATKLVLGSFEFPVSQYPVEERNGRLYIREDRAITAPVTLRVVESWIDTDGVVTKRCSDVTLPASINEVARAEPRDDDMLLVFTHPHCLFENGRIWVAKADETSLHFVGVSSDIAADSLTFVDETTVRVAAPPRASTFADAALVCPSRADLSDVCRALQSRLSLWGVRASVCFHDQTGKVALKFAKPFTQSRGYAVDISGTALRLFGMASARKIAQEMPRAPRSSILDISSSVAELCFQSLAASFDHVAFSPGWYAPCHRSFSPSPSHRIHAEASGQLNRLHLFPADAQRCLVMQIAGDVVAVPLLCGMHDGDTLCHAFNESHARVRGRGGAMVTLSYDKVQAAFTLAARWVDDEAECLFDVLFAHADSIDGDRLGFGDDNLYGRSVYTSTARVKVAALANHYALREVEGQGRFALHAVPLPVLDAIVRSKRGGVVTIATYMAGLPFACNAPTGSEVIVSTAATTLQVTDTDDDGAPSEIHATRSSMRGSRRGHVTGCHLHTMTLHVGSIPSLAVGHALRLVVPPRPFSLSFGLLPMSLGRQLGFPPGVFSSGRSESCVVAPGIYDLDHVDYVLLHLVNLPSIGTTLIHQVGNSVTTPFVKLVMYPSLREERMLPREVNLASGCRLRNIQLSVRNPDGTRYNFYGARFSLSIASVCAA